MTDLSVLGLGAMGSALARALLASGRSVSVWNRSAAKAEPLRAAGASVAPSAREAIAASPLSIVCVGNYADSAEVLAGARDALADRTLIQFTTGTPSQAEELGAWVRASGADYLDGAIMAYPSEIGRAETLLLVGGAGPTFARCEAVLRALGGATLHVGDDLGLPATLDAALLLPIVAMAVAAIQGAALCERRGFPVREYASMVAALLPVAAHQVEHLAATIAENRFDQPEAALNTYAAAFAAGAADLRMQGVRAEVVEFLSGIMSRAVADGHGERELSALIHAMR